MGVAGFEPSPFGSEGYALYCTYENNRNDITFSHSLVSLA